jgi:hypothetical protein
MPKLPLRWCHEDDGTVVIVDAHGFPICAMAERTRKSEDEAQWLVAKVNGSYE